MSGPRAFQWIGGPAASPMIINSTQSRAEFLMIAALTGVGKRRAK